MRPFSDIDLHAFVDNQISADRRESITAYLKTAPADAARVESWRRQNDAIRAVFSGASMEPVPLWLTVGQIASSGRDKPVALEKRWSGKGPAQSAIRPLNPHRKRARSGSRFVLAAVLGFVAGLSLPYSLPRLHGLADWRPPAFAGLELRRDFVRRTLDAHATFGLDRDRPVEVIDNPEGILARWLTHHVPFPVRIPVLTETGWTLRGGRVAPGDLGPGALLVYENDSGDRLSLYIGRTASPTGDTAYDLTPDGVLMWTDGAMGYGVATSKPADWLSSHARELYDAIRSAER